MQTRHMPAAVRSSRPMAFSWASPPQLPSWVQRRLPSAPRLRARPLWRFAQSMHSSICQQISINKAVEKKEQTGWPALFAIFNNPVKRVYTKHHIKSVFRVGLNTSNKNSCNRFYYSACNDTLLANKYPLALQGSLALLEHTYAGLFFHTSGISRVVPYPCQKSSCYFRCHSTYQIAGLGYLQYSNRDLLSCNTNYSMKTNTVLCARFSQYSQCNSYTRLPFYRHS